MKLNIFKKKPGGSFFGNLIRSITSSVIPGGDLFNRYVNPTPDENGHSRWFTGGNSNSLQ